MPTAGEPYADTVNRLFASIAEGILDEGIICFNYFRGKDSDTAARELGAWARSQSIKVEFELRREGGVDVIYVFLTAR
ncbi:MAG TPA: hypothetical protein VFT23_03890 [Burkholderiales bacterium]|nr:hypothetical protein [Burkholderiales bacterium]